jgi:hypothetical protein
MKKVILELQPEEEKVYFKDLTRRDLIGMQNKAGVKFILYAREDGYDFIGDNNLIIGSEVQYNTFNEAIDNCHSLFVFDTTKELFKWMSE